MNSGTIGAPPGRRGRLSSLASSFGTVLILLAAAFWYSETYGSDRWLALPVIIMCFLAVVLSLRIIDPGRLPRHLAVMGVALALAVAGAMAGNQTMVNTALLAVGFYAFYGVVLVLWWVLTQRSVSLEVIFGAVCVYVLIGTVFAWIYGFGSSLDPEVFSPPIDTAAEGPGKMGYFSFMTLTTVGYGDITPAAAWMRGVTVLEALTGQIFLVVLIARLVGMHTAQRMADERQAAGG
jgi:voltage-gated potassium channel Kch